MHEHRLYVYIMTMVVMNVCADACSDETMELTSSRGLFGTNYQFNESCKWSIQVNEDQVKTSGIYSLKINAQDNERDTYYIYRLCYSGIPSQ